MRKIRPQMLIALALVGMLVLPEVDTHAAETHIRGGILNFVVPAEPPSYDGHRETTFAMLHPIRPFYSLLIRVNPENPSSPTDFVGDLALEVPTPTDGGKIYTFNLRRNTSFWDGSKHLSSIAIVKAAAGIVFPGHPLAATKEELQEIEGYWTDLKKSRAEARRLLREAGVPEGFAFKFHIRGVDQPYRIVGIWLIAQWKSIGLNAEPWVQPTDPFFATLRSHSATFQVSIDPNCQAVVNPLIDVSKYISDDRAGNNYANYQERVLDELFDKMNCTTEFAEQRRLMRRFEKRVLDEQAHTFPSLWWYRIIPHSSVVRGWKIGPSHYLNQDLANVWLAQ